MPNQIYGIEVYLSSYHRKRSLWTAYPTLQFCFSAIHIHFMVLNFLSSVSYDHSILIDFIVSPETSNFERLLMDYITICIEGWTHLCAACQEMDSYDDHLSFVESNSSNNGATMSIEG